LEHSNKTKESLDEEHGMRAYALDELGQPGSIHDLPEPEPAAGQVRVRVAAASLNPFDNAVIRGFMKDRMEHRFPLIPASDLAGTVDALGPDVRGFAVGDQVFGVSGKMVLGEGTLAELTTVSTGTIAKLPAKVEEVDGAALGLAGVSALDSVDAAAVQPNDVVVIVGASGGIGSYSVQLARLRGAHVIGVTSAPNTEYVKGLGADEVIDRNAGDVLDAIKAKHHDGVAAIIDTGSDAPALARLSEAVRAGGSVISMKGAAGIDELAKRGIKGTNIRTQVTTARLEHLAGLAASGKLKAPRIQTFSLEQAGEAFKVLGHSGGKLVIKI
jgi:NADPH2:quinone reductase